MPLLGYWTIAFSVILFIENFYFRPKLGGYDISGWQDQSRMPWGIAAVTTLLGAIGLSFVGMDQTWVCLSLLSLERQRLLTRGQYIGPAARLIGDYGGDVGDYLVFVLVIFLYPILRTLEIKKFGR